MKRKFQEESDQQCQMPQKGQEGKDRRCPLGRKTGRLLVNLKSPILLRMLKMKAEHF